MPTCYDCDLWGGTAQAARYSCPEDRKDLWEAHLTACPTQTRWVVEAVAAVFSAISIPSAPPSSQPKET